MADFLDIDQDLLAAAAEASPDAREDDHDGLAAWISSLKAQEKDALLARAAAGEGVAVQALLSRRFRRARGGNEAAVPAGTAAELWKAAGDRKAAREKAEEERRRGQQARDGAAKAAAYTQRLDELATRQEAAWKRAGTLIETKNPRDYDTAVTLLSDLRALAERQGDKAAFTSRFLSLCEQHHRKPEVRWTIFLVGMLGTFGLNFPVVLTAMAKSAFGGDASTHGLFNIAVGLGSAVGAVLAGSGARPKTRIVVGAAILFGAMQAAAALAPDMAVFLVLIAGMGFANLVCQALANASVQLEVDPELRGRVMGLYMLVFVGGTPIGAPVAGAVTSHYGARGGMLLCGVIPLLAALVTAATIYGRRRR